MTKNITLTTRFKLILLFGISFFLTQQLTAQFASIQYYYPNSPHLNAFTFTDHLNGFAVEDGWTQPTYSQGIIIKTNDGGVSWSSSIIFDSCNFIDIVNADDTSLFAYGSIFKDSIWNAVIARSLNNGITWDTSLFYDIVPKGYAQSLQFTSPNTGYATGRGNSWTNSVLLKTIDKGNTWTVMNSGIVPFPIEFITDSIGFGMNDSNLMKTIDGGLTWTNTPFVFPPYSVMQIDFPSPNVGYLAQAGPFPDSTSFYKTIDGGNTWNFISTAGSMYGTRMLQFSSDLKGFFVQDFMVYHTSDGGLTWIETMGTNPYNNENSFQSDENVKDVFFVNADTGYIGGWDYLFRTNNGGGAPLSIEDNLNPGSAISIYPNPVKDIFNIKSDKHIEQIQVFSIDGSLLHTYKENPKCTITINIETLAKGMFILKVTTSNKVHSRVVVKE